MIIKYFAWIKNITKIDQEKINDKKIKDIKSLKIYLSKKYPKLKKYIFKDGMIRFAINLEYSTKNKRIKPKDEIAIFPPVSGG
tara:strand:+ start:1498 stop:1746 length:249 start_codon:yes stop_codon:yes gene_type:complete